MHFDSSVNFAPVIESAAPAFSGRRWPGKKRWYIVIKWDLLTEWMASDTAAHTGKCSLCLNFPSTPISLIPLVSSTNFTVIYNAFSARFPVRLACLKSISRNTILLLHRSCTPELNWKLFYRLYKTFLFALESNSSTNMKVLWTKCLSLCYRRPFVDSCKYSVMRFTKTCKHRRDSRNLLWICRYASYKETERGREDTWYKFSVFCWT